jgi:hypothetical protein
MEGMRQKRAWGVIMTDDERVQKLDTALNAICAVEEECRADDSIAFSRRITRALYDARKGVLKARADAMRCPRCCEVVECKCVSASTP